MFSFQLFLFRTTNPIAISIQECAPRSNNRHTVYLTLSTFIISALIFSGLNEATIIGNERNLILQIGMEEKVPRNKTHTHTHI